MAIYEREDSIAYWITIRDRTKTKVDPSTVSITIKDPCDFVLVNSQAMARDSTGVYYYNYDSLSSTATYGKYKIEVKSTSGTSQVAVEHDKFYVMPWRVTDDVRDITGASETKDVDDDALSDICWKAYKEALRDIYIHHYEETPNGNPNTGAGFDGINTSFQSNFFPIADINGDGSITGNNTSCATDINAWWVDNNGSYQRAIITVSKYQRGEISMYQNDGSTAIPANNEGVYIDYWHQYGSYDEELFRNAVGHLAADMVMRRLKEVDRVTLGDIASNLPIIEKDSRRFYRKYRQLINQVRKPMVAGV